MGKAVAQTPGLHGVGLEKEEEGGQETTYLHGGRGDLLAVAAVSADELLHVGVHVLEDEVEDGLPLLVEALLEVQQAHHVRVLLVLESSSSRSSGCLSLGIDALNILVNRFTETERGRGMSAQTIGLS
jgi:hypothetical protein